MDLSIIIVNWNSAEYVRACVRSIMSQTEAVKFEIIVVDNASFDACGEQLAREFPGVIFVQSGENLGFGGANNLGVQRAQGRVLLFLNPDTEVLDQAIDRLYHHFLATHDNGVVGCRLLNSDRSLQTSCVQAFPTVWNQVLDCDLLRRWSPRASLWGTRAFWDSTTSPVEVQVVSGACMMIRREVFETLGGFSPAFFMYGEDLDLCARVVRSGLRNYYVADCEIVHHGGGPSRHVPSTLSVVMMRQSVGLCLRRSHGRTAAVSYRVAMALSACIRLLILALASPIWRRRGDARLWRGSLRKWRAILSWSIGLDRRAQRMSYSERRGLVVTARG